MLLRLRTQGFRNLEDSALELAAGRHLFLGGTGEGKTSVLEAMYVATTTRSFRTHHLKDCISWRGEDGASTGFVVEVQVETGARVDLRVGLDLQTGPSRALNGTHSRLADHLGCVPLLAWSSRDLEVLSGLPEARRRMLDRGLVARRPVLIDEMSRYRRALDQKRAAVKSGAELRPWNELLARSGHELARERQQQCALLSAAFDECHAVAGLDQPPLEIRYVPSCPEQIASAEELLTALSAREAEERRRRRVLLGPHRDEVLFLWAERPVGRVASAGERKSVGLLLAAAQAKALERVARPPVVLLDDLDAELDQPTLERVWKCFSQVEQMFVTSNRPMVWEHIRTECRWAVSDGSVEPLGNTV